MMTVSIASSRSCQKLRRGKRGFLVWVMRPLHSKFVNKLSYTLFFVNSSSQFCEGNKCSSHLSSQCPPTALRATPREDREPSSKVTIHPPPSGTPSKGRQKYKLQNISTPSSKAVHLSRG
jgi:hypothetical protein